MTPVEVAGIGFNWDGKLRVKLKVPTLIKKSGKNPPKTQEPKIYLV